MSSINSVLNGTGVSWYSNNISEEWGELKSSSRTMKGNESAIDPMS